MASYIKKRLQSVTKLFKSTTIDTSTKNEARLRNEAIHRQAGIEKTEPKQSWQIVFGRELPKLKREIYLIKDFTMRDLWMEDLFIYHKIIAMIPEENFFEPEIYELHWKV